VRFTVLQAERTSRTASASNWGPWAFTLRLVQPVYTGGALAGYLMLAKEIEDVLEARRDREGLELAVVIRKEHLNRQSWEEGMRRLGREADWEGLPQSVVIFTSQAHLPMPSRPGPTAILPTVKRTARLPGGKDWRVAALPLAMLRALRPATC